MLSKPAFFLLIVFTAFGATATTHTAGTDEQAATKRLGVLVGRWQSEAASLETPFSHAGKISSSLECRWSPQKNFLVCEQLVSDSNRGSHTQLSVYSYNSKDGNYTISTMAGPGSVPHNVTMVVEGNLWTYRGSFEANGKKVEIRTTNDFSVPDTETFKTEFSDDGGAHWTLSFQGTAHKIGP